MIGYSTIGVSDLKHATAFYTDLFADLGATVKIDAGRIVFIGTERGAPMIALCTPYDGAPASVGNGSMIAFSAPTKEAADALYHKAIALGATCDGAPGQRVPDRFYGSYVRDLDGHKLCFFVFS